jgi:hypothetical protein
MTTGRRPVVNPPAKLNENVLIAGSPCPIWGQGIGAYGLNKNFANNNRYLKEPTLKGTQPAFLRSKVYP